MNHAPTTVAFRATVQLGGKTATGIEVPDDVVAALGSSRRPAVRATITGYTYRSSVASMRGRFMLPVSAAVREAAGVAAGDEVDVELELDTEPRIVAVPPDFAAALAGDDEAAGRVRAPVLQPQAAPRARDRGRQDRRDAPAPHRQGHRDAARRARLIHLGACRPIGAPHASAPV